MAFGNASSHQSIAEINIIPLADIMLVLLIVFMISAPPLSQQMDLTLPGITREHTEKTPPDPIRLRIAADGSTFWNEDATPVTALPAMLAGEVARDPANTPRLEIDADGDADYQALTRVLAAAHNADYANIAFVQARR